jgi:soluble lytic murein transglycosylase-like protein
MQINWKAHRTGLTSSFSGIDSRTDIYDPKKNILAGTYIFSCYLRSSGGDVQKALKRYVGGNAPRYVSGVINCRKELDTRFAQHINKVN